MENESSGIVELKRSERIYSHDSGPSGLDVTAPYDLEVGTGYNFISGWKNDFNAALVLTDGDRIGQAEMTDDPNPQQVNNYKLVSDEHEYASSLNVSANASASYWGVNVSGSVAALIESGASATSVSAFVQTLIGTKTCMLRGFKNIRFTKFAEDLLTVDENGVKQKKANKARLLAFIACFGTHYVEGYSYGGSFNGLVTVETSSNQDHKAVAASLEVSNAAGNLSTAFSDSVTSLTKNHAVKVTATSIGASGIGFTTNVDGLLAADEKFQKAVTEKGGIPIVAHLVPWGNAEPLWQLVPAELIVECLTFGNMDTPLVQECQNDLNLLSYMRNCVSAYRREYLSPEGAWTFYSYSTDSVARINTLLNALEDPKSKKGLLTDAYDALCDISLMDLNRGPTPPALQKLKSAMDTVTDTWADLQAAIAARPYQRTLQFQFYDSKGNEKDGIIRTPGNTLQSLGRNEGAQTLQLLSHPSEKLLYSIQTAWTPMHDSRCGCYITFESQPYFLDNLDKRELVLTTDAKVTKGNLTVRWTA
jgi:hypothetical protein